MTPSGYVPTTPRREQFYTLLNSPNFWVRNDAYTRHPRPAALKKFKELPLTHDDLNAIRMNTHNDYNIMRLLSHHSAWDVEWVKEAMLNRVNQAGNVAMLRFIAFEIARNNPTLQLIQKLAGTVDTFTLGTILPAIDTLSDEAVQYLVQNGHYSALADPRVSAETLTSLWVDKYEHLDESKYEPYWFLRQTVYNPNTPSFLLDIISVRKTVLEHIDQAYYLSHPNLSSNTIQFLTPLYSRDYFARRVIANNPNTPTTILRKLTKSTVRSVAQAAIENLQNRQKDKKTP